MRRRRWMGALLIVAVLAGCSGGGGGGGGGNAQVQVSDDQVKGAVKKVLTETDQKDFLASQVKTATGTVMLEKSLDTQEGQKVLADAIKKGIGDTHGQAAIAEAFGKMAENAKFRAQLQLIVRDVVQEMLMKGVQGGAGGGGGQQAGGGGGGQGGGGEGGGGGGGGQ